MNPTLPIDRPQAHSSVASPNPPQNASSMQEEIARLLGKPTRRPSGSPLEPSAGSSALAPCAMSIGRVTGVQPEGRLVLCVGGQVLEAIAATSCLLRPEPGDLVSLLSHQDGAWVTAVLERDPARPVALDLGKTELAIRAGAITLEAEDLTLSAQKLASHATVSVTACGDRYANVAGTDSTNARCTLVRTSGHMGLHAGDTSITAEALIKVDAGQVHMC